MLNPSSPLAALLAAPFRPGDVRFIGLRPARRQPMNAVKVAVLDPDDGLQGDHYGSRTTRARQVTLIATEHLAAVASYLGREFVRPEELRRNIVVSGVNLLALTRFSLGTAVLEVTGPCHPCSRMEATLGVGGYNAVRGHGGITARVVTGGVVRIGDPIAAMAPSCPSHADRVGGRP